MALTPSFSITPTSNPSSFVITDTSTGSDGTITDRKINIADVNNNQFVPTIDFPIAQSSITLSILTEDVALSVTVTWNNSGGTAVYTVNQIYAFTGYALQFLYQLTQFQIANPQIVNDLNWYGNKMKFFVIMQSAINAISTGQSLSAAQSQILLYQEMITNQNDYF